MVSDLLGIFTGLTDLLSGSGIELPFQVALDGAAAAYGMAADFATDANGDPVAAAVDVKAQEIEATTQSAVEATLDNLDRLRDIVLADYAKLSRLAVAAEGPWRWNTNLHDAAVDRPGVSTQQTAATGLLAAAGESFSLFPYDAWSHNNHAMANAADYFCPSAPFAPFGKVGERQPSPPSAQAHLPTQPRGVSQGS